ncbi:uncharacterized protein B0H18DRAFT_1029288, partial [Fomitopsis serialis]|uniref:uncharacterized protein n=1 Tax=Fomitopsis serialis TaxID=139415 RepID=UPI002008785A
MGSAMSRSRICPPRQSRPPVAHPARTVSPLSVIPGPSSSTLRTQTNPHSMSGGRIRILPVPCSVRSSTRDTWSPPQRGTGGQDRAM